MSDFAIGDIDYSYLHQNPNPSAKYGLVLTYWSSNIDDLEFFLNLIDKIVNSLLVLRIMYSKLFNI